MSGELEVYWIGIKYKRLQSQEIERKFIWSNFHYSYKMFCSFSWFLKTWLLKCKCVYVCVPCIIITVGVTLGLWHWGMTVDWVWQQCWSGLRLLWLKLIGNWRKLNNVLLRKLYLLPDIIRIIEEGKEGEWLGHVEWMWHETCAQVYQNFIIIM